MLRAVTKIWAAKKKKKSKNKNQKKTTDAMW